MLGSGTKEAAEKRMKNKAGHELRQQIPQVNLLLNILGRREDGFHDSGHHATGAVV